MKSKKILAIIITYNPELKLLKNNLDAVQENIGDNYLIIDNNSENNNEMDTFVDDEKLISLNQNLGIAAAQNIGFKMAIKMDYTWVLLLDQDSVIPSNMILEMEKTKEFYDPKTGMIGTSIGEEGFEDKGVIRKNDLIASGTLIKIEAWINAGGFDETLFIDYVDFDFDARVKMCSYDIFENTNIKIEHEIGKIFFAPFRGKILHLGKHRGIFSDHSAFRLYYFYRNSIIVKKRYPSFFYDSKHPVWANIKRLREILLYSQPILKKIRFAFKGIIEGASYSPLKDKNFQQIMEHINEKD